MKNLITTLVMLLALFSSTSLFAANCGGTTTCNCGDTVTSNYTLPANLGPCSGSGLIITASNIVLDLNSHIITGNGSGTPTNETYGIQLNPGDGASVKNGTVGGGFFIGISIRGTYRSQITDVYSVDNLRYGVKVSNDAHHNTMRSITVTGNDDEGVHFGDTTDTGGIYNNKIYTSAIYDNATAQIYMLGDNNVVSTVDTTCSSGVGTSSVILNHSTHDNIVERVTANRTIFIQNGAYDNLVQNNTLNGAGYRVRKSVSTNPTPFNNHIFQGSVTNADFCINVNEATSNNTADSITLGTCTTKKLRLTGNSIFTTVNMTIQPSEAFIEAGSTWIQQ